MIGVLADPAQEEVVREFFELFKTPWEFYQKNRKYDVVLCSGNRTQPVDASLIIVYAGSPIQFDDEKNRQIAPSQDEHRLLAYRGTRLPIYGDFVTFPGEKNQLLAHEASREAAVWIERSKEITTVRVGYDLFAEVGSLLTVGQPAIHAGIPALELHIAFLRDVITFCGLPLVEIPPIPEGYAFVTCLTHDVDHPSIRKHKWDHTMLGFLYRAVVGSVAARLNGRISTPELLRNWIAALKLPLVYLGLAKDFWSDFDDRYLELEKGLPSTFFFIPFKNRPGKNLTGAAPVYRAAAYGAADLGKTIQKLLSAGSEVGLHGIDAWLDSSQGRREFDEIRQLTGLSQIGVRMHWLYYGKQSPVVLEEAEAAYDSTVGYNETVGYRAGTTQVYKQLRTSRLLELPLHVMDTALFYPNYRNLSKQDAKGLVSRMMDQAVEFGGCITLNWHDRSLAPERLWGDCYRDLTDDMKSRGAWFATAGQAVSWFRKRRLVGFDGSRVDSGEVLVRVPADAEETSLPGLRLRIHEARKPENTHEQGQLRYVDTPISDKTSIRVSCAASQ